MIKCAIKQSRQRRLVHIALREEPRVYTESVGEDPRRKVMIIPTSPEDSAGPSSTVSLSELLDQALSFIGMPLTENSSIGPELTKVRWARSASGCGHSNPSRSFNHSDG